MAQKQKLPEEFESAREASAAESANVHGVVACVSPMKKGKRAQFFDAKLTDGEEQKSVYDKVSQDSILCT